jgi:hypothetical protein
MEACPTFELSAPGMAPPGVRTQILKAAANSKLGDKRAVSVNVLTREVVKQPSSVTYFDKKAPPRVVVVLVDLKMLRERTNGRAEQCNLNLRGTCVGPVGLIC